ncbi:MAG: hypothetical protein IH984_10200 [Planctomycetes bacterium]|nr:hypothetical protein [Planctomycetota bacterium]
MLLPEKHICLAESILGLGAFIIEQLDRARSVDQLHDRVSEACEGPELPAYHDFDSILLAVLFLFSIGAVEMTNTGSIRRCAS